MFFKRFFAVPVVLFLVAASPVLSLGQERAEPDVKPEIEIPKQNFAEHFLKDHGQLWLSPFKIKRGDVKWLAPLAGGAAALVLSRADWKFSENVRDAEGLRPASRTLSKLGGGGPMALASGTVFGIGKLAKNEKAANTGKLALEAVVHTDLLVRGLKRVINRERPNKAFGDGGFWGGGESFPSGHAATTFAFATVVADQYKDKKWVVFGAYGLATAVSLSRVGGLHHFPSDVVVGGVAGHLIGRYILRHHNSEIH